MIQQNKPRKRKPLVKTEKQLRAEKLIDQLETNLTKLGFDVKEGNQWDSPAHALQNLKQHLFAAYRKEQQQRTHARILHKMMTARPRPPASNTGIMFWLAKYHNGEGTYLAELETFEQDSMRAVENIATEYRRKMKAAAK